MAAKIRTFQSYIDFAIQRNRDKNGNADILQAKEFVVNALKNLSVDPEWAHFHQRTRITLQPPYATGTIAVNHGGTAVTGTGTGWATVLIDSTYVMLIGDSDIEYPVSAVGSDTGITLEFPYNAEDGQNASGVTYTLIKREYLLPENFREMLHISEAGQDFDPLTRMNISELLRVAQQSQETGQPDWYAVSSKNTDSRDYITFQPLPQDYPYPTYDVWYLRMPTRLMEDDGDYVATTVVVDWPDNLASVLEAAVEVEAARKNTDSNELAMALQNLNVLKATHVRGTVKDQNRLRIGLTMPGRVNGNPQVTVTPEAGV